MIYFTTKIQLNTSHKLSGYISQRTQHCLLYKDRSDINLEENIFRILRKSYKTPKYAVWRKYKVLGPRKAGLSLKYLFVLKKNVIYRILIRHGQT